MEVRFYAAPILGVLLATQFAFAALADDYAPAVEVPPPAASQADQANYAPSTDNSVSLEEHFFDGSDNVSHGQAAQGGGGGGMTVQLVPTNSTATSGSGYAPGNGASAFVYTPPQLSGASK